ncbi:MAG: hypothetical protein PWP25_340 [Sphaerochaeta sp.]|jgi:regulator of cell morphogenesis and NO signaling|nr:hypothetical protein [Sphaerochaeta sp.]MDN5333765.1 hypothetical protein [Sphaerochaeta sp.]
MIPNTNLLADLAIPALALVRCWASSADGNPIPDSSCPRNRPKLILINYYSFRLCYGTHVNRSNEGEATMKNTASFAQLKKEYLNVLKQYIPIVDRVHGSNHPEFHEVRRIFENMNKQMEQADVKSTELQEFFSQLRRSTQDYRIPEDVCESYEAVYRMLSELDETYHRSE